MGSGTVTDVWTKYV